MDKQTQYWHGPAWATIHRNREDFLWIPLPLPSPHLSFCPPGPHLSLWCTLNHCEEEWNLKGLPLGLLQSSLERIPYGGWGTQRLSSGSYQRKTATGVGAFFFFNLNKKN